MMPHQANDGSKMPDGRPADAQPQWRRDFPVDTAQDEYAARRDFVKFLVLISGAFVVGQAWLGVQNILRQMRGRLPHKKIASIGDISVGETVSFNYPHAHDACLLLRPDEGTFLAYSQKCTHLACAVLPDVKNNQMTCPCHVGKFDMQTGRPLAGPPRRPLPRITLERRGDAIYATNVELRT